ncbi:hypothetical protein Q4603_00325 [Zobellia galactanivorans]|uniref:Conserved hypothetical lipoprotein n=1 Tax=Zobellia galactanivorans (strain DSM 12802 / CCUG 47099 / CIP 106680 / NCIMB 13871 / Dsij) TaxID=63186 RepID=G0L658_ZOBGA|nr:MULTISPECIES: hypothetical protein [Zobellia]MBU3027645.1 hypothetical protein [Zobellia galactanivorans]MDO6807026.1 hypothetical protein [Zobellia galactanivorans]OWW23931.1 hypothetical protein B4Q04_17625 [Zobellia sp. OII3]CAZ96730.1 Conserved hypothetical lipoprotein [Zobellia galactanivorans]
MKTIVTLSCLIICLTSCKDEKDTSFSIITDRVGKLDRISLVRDLDIIYENDSIVKDSTIANRANNSKKIKIFEKGGKPLLTLTPNSDSIPTIENIRIEDPRFTTEKGVGLNSTFKDIKDNYTIRKVITSMNNVVILLKDSDVYFTISKEELPSSLRYASSVNIEAVQIPDDAKIKYMMVAWD